MDMSGYIRQVADQVNSGYFWSKKATVQQYDPQRHMAQVLLQPENLQTGWLQVSSFMSGQGYGITVGLIPGQEVLVHFENGDLNSGVIGSILYSNEDPIKTEPGEIKIVHQSGSYIKFFNDGTIEIHGKVLNLMGDNAVYIGTGGSGSLTTNCDIQNTYVTTSGVSGTYNASLEVDHSDS